ncbi:HNH endonuclease [Bradyrhizobium sp. SZCCHNRI3043]|uniref:HNH endonuclease n=1 Tax=Bradyrhizobium sp. SZCCHNRI3043 TaxID=3057292 RepID=UPI0039657EC5
MKTKRRHDRRWLLATAKTVAEQLKMQSKGTRLRIRIPRGTSGTNTDGWSAVVGNLGRDQPKLEIWLDRFSGYPDRKLFACFRSESRQQIIAITKRVSRKLWPVRTVTPEDTERAAHLFLAERMRRSEFGTPFLEKYEGGRTFYGIYDPTRETSESVNLHFCARAVSFFEDVARTLPHAKSMDGEPDTYPHYENRKRVASHLKRERSRYLATECKIRDSYRCRVCGFEFEKVYGRLGSGFAEAHHRVPLGQLRDQVRTRVEDLITVCANCHRMLHRMAGRRDDANKLMRAVGG